MSYLCRVVAENDAISTWILSVITAKDGGTHTVHSIVQEPILGWFSQEVTIICSEKEPESH